MKVILFKFLVLTKINITIAAQSLIVASDPSPQISVQISFVVEEPPEQVHPDSIPHEWFSMKTSWIFQ